MDRLPDGGRVFMCPWTGFQDWDMVIKLGTAVFLGALIGLERGAHGKEAGFRTYALVSLGSALMMLVSVNIFETYRGLSNVDPGRIAGQVVTGIGFLGAGAIIRSQERVRGLTTAAGIWVVCGIGLACGLGAYQEAILGTAFALIILAFFSSVEHKLLRSKDRKPSQ